MNSCPKDDLEHILEKTRPLWEEARSQKFFLTGGTGFVGRWMLESFLFINRKLKLNAEMSVLSRNPEIFLERSPEFKTFQELAFVKGEIRSFSAEKSFSFIVHAAAPPDTKLHAKAPKEVFDCIVGGAKRILALADAKETKKLLFISSGAVYGRQPKEVSHVPESFMNRSTKLAIGYAEGKRTAEVLLESHPSTKTEIKTARLFSSFGPFLPQTGQYAIGNFMDSALHDKPLHILGNGKPKRGYLYAADMAIWFWTILFTGKNRASYNVGDDNSVSLRETADLINSSLKQNKLPIIVDHPEDLTEEIYVPDTSRAQNELHLKQWIDLRTSILKTFAWSVKQEGDQV